MRASIAHCQEGLPEKLMANVARVELRCYRFVCPDCGMTDAELGHLATADEIHCVVCLIDDNRHVRLRRWFLERADTGMEARRGLAPRPH